MVSHTRRPDGYRRNRCISLSFCVVALVLFLGWILIISGIVGISLIGAQNVPNFWLQLVSAVLSIIVGVLFLRRPGEAVVTLALLLIVFFMVEGFAKIVFFRSRFGRFQTGAGS